MDPEGSLSHSQVLATCPYPEPAPSNPYPTTLFLKIHLNIILPSTPRSPSGLFPSSFSTKTLSRPLLFPYVLHATPISLFSILSTEKYCVMSIDHYAPLYVVFSTTLLSCPSYVQIFSSVPYSQTPLAYIPPSICTTKFHTRTPLLTLWNKLY